MAAIALGAFAYAVTNFFDIKAVGLVYAAPVKLAFRSEWAWGLIANFGVPGFVLVLVAEVVPWALLFGAIYFAWAASKGRLIGGDRTSPKKPPEAIIQLSGSFYQDLRPWSPGRCVTAVR